MRKSGAAAFPELLTGNGIIKDQVYHALREAILSGRLHAGSKVPSGRALAEMMGISRNSVIAGLSGCRMRVISSPGAARVPLWRIICRITPSAVRWHPRRMKPENW